MAFSLYAATVPSYRQILGAVSGLLGTVEAFSTEKGIAPEDIIQARLAADMLPFAYQVKSTAVHSLGAIEGVRRGVFSPDVTRPPDNFAGLKARIAETLAALEAIEASEVDAFVGHDMRFAFGDRHIDFTAENFLLSFYDLRHPALEGDPAREARFRGQAAHEEILQGALGFEAQKGSHAVQLRREFALERAIARLRSNIAELRIKRPALH